MEVEDLGTAISTQEKEKKDLDSKFVPTPESQIYLMGNFSSCQLILLDLPMTLFNALAPEVTTILSGRCFSFRPKVQQFQR